MFWNKRHPKKRYLITKSGYNMDWIVYDVLHHIFSFDELRAVKNNDEILALFCQAVTELKEDNAKLRDRIYILQDIVADKEAQE